MDPRALHPLFLIARHDLVEVAWQTQENVLSVQSRSHPPHGPAFNTAKEARYPRPMCTALCDVLDTVAQENVRTLGRPNACSQLVSECLPVTCVCLPAVPPLDGKRCLSCSVPNLPWPSSLIAEQLTLSALAMARAGCRAPAPREGAEGQTSPVCEADCVWQAPCSRATFHEWVFLKD